MTTAIRFTPCFGELGERHVGVGLQPLGAAEARLEGDPQLVLRPAEPLAQQPRRLQALAVIGVALVEIVASACRDRRRAPPPARSRARARRRVERRGQRRRYRPGRRDRAAACAPPAASASSCSAAKASSLAVAVVARGVLRIERREEDAVAARLLQRLEPRRRSTARRSASPSRRRCRSPPSRARELLGLRAGDGRRAAPRSAPCSRCARRRGRISAAASSGRCRLRIGHQSGRGISMTRAVGQELLEIAPHRPVVGAVRRAEIDEEHADPAGLTGGWPGSRVGIGPG